MTKLRRISKNKILISFLLSLLLGTIIISPNLIAGKGIFSLIADFNIQQIPFNQMINNSIKEGSILWSWYNELGSNFIGTFSFYNLFSPFNIIGYLFPSNWFPYLIGPIFILKYGIAGLTSYLFLKRYVKNKNYAIIGSLLYAFSGFQLTNTLFYHFHDVVAFFPLLLYTLDNLMYDNKKVWFSLSVALVAFTNWFFFIGQVVFVIIYYIVKLITKNYNFSFKKTFLVFFEGLIGVFLAGIVLVPSFLFTISNPRINSEWTFNNMFKYGYISMYLEIFRSFIFPSEIMYVRSFLTEMNYTSVELYLPFFGSVLAFSYFLKKPKEWQNILMIICVVFMLIPILNSIFFAFKNNYYARWFYMPTLIMSLMTAKCLDSNVKSNNGIMITLLGLATFLSAICYCFIKNPNNNIVFDKVYLLLSIIFMIINLVLVYYITGIKKTKLKIILCIVCIFLYSGLWGNYTIYKYKNNTFKLNDNYKTYLDSKNYIKFDNIVRTNSSNTCDYNYGYILGTNNIKSFNSNINGSNFKFYNSINYNREVSTIINPDDKNINDFLSVEYMISCGDEELHNYGYELKETNGVYKIYYNPSHKKMGFAPNDYMSLEKFEKLSTEEKKQKLNNTMILNKEQIKKYKGLYNSKIEYDFNEYKYIPNGFKSKIKSNKEALALYTIPYDDGWTAKLNGKNVKIEEVDNGFMAIKINEGNNNIEFKYVTPGLKLGALITLTSIFLIFLYCLMMKRKSIN